MSKKAFDKIVAGLNEVLDVARGKAKPSKLYAPPEINDERRDLRDDNTK